MHKRLCGDIGKYSSSNNLMGAKKSSSGVSDLYFKDMNKRFNSPPSNENRNKDLNSVALTSVAEEFP
jgi:hypothetical protein